MSKNPKLSKTDPKTISIELQQVSTVELDIKYDYKGEPPAGITIEDPLFVERGQTACPVGSQPRVTSSIGASVRTPAHHSERRVGAASSIVVTS